MMTAAPREVPSLRIAFSHGGGTFPPVPGGARRAPHGLPRSPAEYARRFYYDTLLFDGGRCAT